MRVRTFEFHHSVFAEWKKDTPEIVAEALDCDIKLMKLDRIIKNDEKDKQGVIDLILEYGEDIKNMFV